MAKRIKSIQTARSKFPLSLVIGKVASPTAFTATTDANLMTWSVAAVTTEDEGNLLMQSKKAGEPDTAYGFLLETDRDTTSGSVVMGIHDQDYNLRCCRKPSGSALNRVNSDWAYTNVRTGPPEVSSAQIIGDDSINEGEAKSWTVTQHWTDGTVVADAQGYTLSATEGNVTGNQLAVPTNEVSEGDRDVTLTFTHTDGSSISRVIRAVDMTVPVTTPEASITASDISYLDGVMKLKWTLSRTGNTAEAVKINIRHSATTNGVLTAYKWDIPSGQPSVTGNYQYIVANVGDTLEYHVDAVTQDILDAGFPTYTVGTPASVVITVADYLPATPPPETEPTTGSYTAKAVPDKAVLTYEGALTLSSGSFSGTNTLVISGRNFRTSDPNAFAIDGRSIGANRKVIIENCVFDARGRAINFLGVNVDIEIRNCFFFSSGYCNNTWGSNIFCFSNAKRVVVENNYARGVAGGIIEVTAAGTVEITHRYNKFFNISAATGPTTKTGANWLNLRGAKNTVQTANVLVEWDEIIQDESNEGRPEDMLSISYFKGTPASPVTIRYNCIYKAYGFPYNATDGWSGSGIMVESPRSIANDEAQTKEQVTQHIHIHDNYCIGMGRGAIKTFTSNNTLVENNRIIYSRRYLDNTERNLYTTGIGGMNYYKKEGTTFNNKFLNNYIKWASGAGGGDAIDYYTPTDGINTDASNPTYNGTLEVEFIGTVIDGVAAKLEDEVHNYNLWKGIRNDNGYVNGPKEGVPIAITEDYNDETNTILIRIA